ncbi:MAG: hypothetical protein GY820_32225, partial [Gammaproteobacteria bacterium]|nr:hypothetical protein [Gammaproteobacteria bacterium]
MSVKHGDLNEVYKAILPPIGDVEIASCTGGNVPIMGQAIVRIQIGEIKCNTPMLIMKTNNPRAECLLGVYAMRQMGFMLFAPTGEELLGHDLSQLPGDQRPKVEAPVILPKTAHTQVNLLKCYSTTPLELEENDSKCTSKVLSESVQPLINARGSVGVDTISSASLCKSNQFTTELGLNKGQQHQQK